MRYGTISGVYAYNVDVGNYTSCTISGLQEGETYYFAATAYNANNIESSLSEELVHTLPIQSSPPPPVNTDGDGILDNDEIDIYGTDPDRTDTDGDGINDGEELEYWGNKWNLDYDGDGVVNLLDADSDGDGLSDGIEVSGGYDPADPLDVNKAGTRITEGLQVLYTFDAGSGDTVYDVSGEGTPLNLTIADPDRINWLPSGGMSVNATTIIQSAGAATKIIDACQSSNEITIEAWLKPANVSPTEKDPARIVTLSKNSSNQNLTLGQRTAKYIVRSRTTETGMGGKPELQTSLTNELKHVVFTRDSSGNRKIYVDNTLVAEDATVGGDFSNWDTNAGLALANEFGEGRGWLGEYYLVAIYDHTLNPQEINQNFQVGVNPDSNQLTPPVDTDGDGISDNAEINIYGTDPDKSDTDNDGLSDGEELEYWGNKWNLDYDGDGMINLLDADSDGDGLSDGIEVSSGYDPADSLDANKTGTRITEGLQVFYTFDAGSGDTVYDVSGKGVPLNLTIADPGRINWLPDGGMSVNATTIIQSADAATKVIEACQSSNEITIEAWVKPANISPTEKDPARIVTLSKDKNNQNFTLGQRTAKYIMRLRTTETRMAGKPELQTALTTELKHVVFTRDSAGNRKIYVDNKLVAEDAAVGGDFSNWDTNAGLALANEFGEGRGWLGEYYLVAVYSRALGKTEIQQNFDAGRPPGF
jgi:hypothetical protein